MACYNPTIGYLLKDHLSPEGKKYVAFQAPTHHQEQWEQIEIHCGSCIGCRLDYSKMWAARITHEAKQWENNWFLTLTYNDANLPITEKIDTETGELITSHPLMPEHCRDFIKKLRRTYDKQTIRYFTAGEYGDRYGRPHYHMAIFNAPKLDDLEKCGASKRGQTLWTSKAIEAMWGKGFITIGSLTVSSAGYIARYMIKKQKGGDAKHYEHDGVPAPFTRQSTMPGIGNTYFYQHRTDIYAQDCVYIQGGDKRAQRIAVPRYYDKLEEVVNPVGLQEAKRRRGIRGKEAKDRCMSKSSLTRSEYLACQARALQSKASALIRQIEKG